MKGKQLREEETGSGLVLTLMVLLVLTVLGVTIGTLTIGSYRLSDANRDDTSAYYIAEAGAVAAYEEIQKEVLKTYKNNETEGAFYSEVSNDVASKNGKAPVEFDKQMGSQPSATIQTEKKDAQHFVIHSTGEIDGKERTVAKELKVNWVEKNTGGGLPEVPKNAALLTQGDIEISAGSKIAGDIHTNSTKKESIEISGNPIFIGTTLFHSSEITGEDLIKRKDNGDWLKDQVAREKNNDFDAYNNWISNVKVPTDQTTDFKQLPDKTVKNSNGNEHKVQHNGNIFMNSYVIDTYKLEVQDNISIDEIKVESGKTLTIDTMGKDYTILVDDLSISSGKVNIVGGGAITFLVDDLSISSGQLNIVGESFVTFLVDDLSILSSDFNIDKKAMATLVVKDDIKFNQISRVNASGKSNQLLLIYTGGSPNFKEITEMNANIISLGKDDEVEIKNANINGAFLTDSDVVDFSGSTLGGSSSLLLVAPNAEVSLEGSYAIKGSVIAKEFEIKGGATLEYEKIVTSGFPFGSSGTTTDPKPEDIISAGVIMEE